MQLKHLSCGATMKGAGSKLVSNRFRTGRGVGGCGVFDPQTHWLGFLAFNLYKGFRAEPSQPTGAEPVRDGVTYRFDTSPAALIPKGLWPWFSM